MVVMRITEKAKLFIGIVLLLAGIVVYLGLIFLFSTQSLYDDNVSWLHKHVLEYISENKPLSIDTNLRYIDGRDLSRSPILGDMMFATMGLQPNNIVPVLGTLYIVLVFAASYVFFRDPLSAGLASLLFGLSPSLGYWFKLNMYGAYVFSSMWLLGFLLLAYGLKKKQIALSVLGVAVMAALWNLWPGSWILLILYSVYLAYQIYRGRVEAHDLVIALLLLLATLPVNLVVGFYGVVSYHVFSYIILLIYTIMGAVEHRLMGRLGLIEKNAWRIIGVFSGLALTLGIMGVLAPCISGLGYYEDYLKTYNPIDDYGVLSVLSVFSIALVLRSRLLRDPRECFTGFIVTSTAITGILASYLDPSLVVVAASALSILAAYGVMRILVFTYSSSSGRTRIIYTILAVWILVGAAAANAVPSADYISRKPSIYYGDLPIEAVNGTIDSSPFLTVLDAVKENTTGKTLVVAYWGLSYWIVGYLGEDTYTLADPVGSIDGWRIISLIYTSDEPTAIGFIKQVIGDREDVDVYVIVTGVYSVEETGGLRISPNAHLGYPILLPPAAPGERPQVVYRPIGDMERIPLYLVTAQYKASDYLDIMKTQFSFQLPLAWTDKMVDTVIAKLVTYAIKQANYTVINDVRSPVPMDVKKPEYFQLVKMSSVKIRELDTGTSKYDVMYFVAAYRVLYK